MPNLLSTFSFKHPDREFSGPAGISWRKLLKNAGLWAICLVVVIELFLHPFLSRRFISHEVDLMLNALATQRFDSPVVVIGDSVGHGIFWKYSQERDRFAVLAANAASEATGQYFFLHRYLAANRKPGAVIACDRTPFLGNLDNRLTENYVQRCFTNWDEIQDLLWVKKNPEFTLKMLAYKAFSTFKYRLHVQAALVGFTNSEIYTGLREMTTGKKDADYGIFKILANWIHRSRKESIATHYVKKMVAELHSADIPYYYLPPPTTLKSANLVRNTLAAFKEIQHLNDRITLLPAPETAYPEALFGDGTHLNADGLRTYQAFIEPELDRIVNQARLREYAGFSSSGSPVFSLAGRQITDHLQPLKDVVFGQAGDRCILRATGGDPSLIIPASVFTPARDMVLHVQMKAPEKTVAKIYYQTETSPGYREENTVRLPVVPGDNILFFDLQEAMAGQAVRFDPGDVPGTYELYAIEVKSIPVPVK